MVCGGNNTAGIVSGSCSRTQYHVVQWSGKEGIQW